MITAEEAQPLVAPEKELLPMLIAGGDLLRTQTRTSLQQHKPDLAQSHPLPRGDGEGQEFLQTLAKKRERTGDQKGLTE